MTEEIDDETFAATITAERKRLGLSQQGAANVLRISRRTLCAWEALENRATLPAKVGAIAILADHKPVDKPSRKA